MANPLMRKFGSQVKTAPKPMTPSQAAAEMLKRRQALGAKTAQGEWMDNLAKDPFRVDGIAKPTPTAQIGQPISLPEGQSPYASAPKPNPVQALKDAAPTAAAQYGFNELVPSSSVSTPASASGYPATEAIMKGTEPTMSVVNSSPVLAETTPGMFEAGGAGLQAGGIAAGALTGFRQLKGLQDIAEGDKLSVGDQAALFLPTFGASALYNPISKFFGSGKGPEQRARDAIRSELQGSGFLDEGYNVTNADESKFDIGRDGGDPQYNVDFSREGIGDVVAAVNPLAAIIGGGDEKRTNDVAGYLANAAASSGDPVENAKKYFADLGYDHAKAYEAIRSMENLAPEKRDAYLSGLDSLFGANAYAPGGSAHGSSKPIKVAPSQAKPEALALPTPSSGDAEQDFVDAIIQVNQAKPMEKKKKKNPLMEKV